MAVVDAEESLGVPRISPMGSETVLLVEDALMVLELTMAIRKERGYAVITASNGEEGLHARKQFEGRIELMITDVVMPRMSGRELAEHIALLRPETKVLYMSGYADDAVVRHGILDDHALKVRDLLDQSAFSET